MKFIFTFLLIISFLHAKDTKSTITVGVGPYFQTQPYKDVSNIILPSPVVFFDNGLFYVRWTQIGMYFLGQKNDTFSWGFSLTGQPRPNSYKASDSQYLQGLEDKKSSFEAGLAFSASMDKFYIDSMFVTDILDRYDSWIFKTEIGYQFSLSKFTFYPSIITLYQSSDFNNYYYGISQEESQNSQYTAYSTKAGLQLGAQTYIKYPLTKNLATLLNMRIDKLSSQAVASPIVVDKYIYSGLLSLIYTFEY